MKSPNTAICAEPHQGQSPVGGYLHAVGDVVPSERISMRLRGCGQEGMHQSITPRNGRMRSTQKGSYIFCIWKPPGGTPRPHAAIRLGKTAFRRVHQKDVSTNFLRKQPRIAYDELNMQRISLPIAMSKKLDCTLQHAILNSALLYLW